MRLSAGVYDVHEGYQGALCVQADCLLLIY